MRRELKDLLYNLQCIDIIGNTNLIISQISISSSDVIPLGLFVAVRGLNNVGHDFINDAISCGAHCIIYESVPKDIEKKIIYTS